MNSSFDWKKYNAIRNSQAIKINSYNLKSKFNYIEKNHYNHIRDIYAISLLLLNNGKNKIISVLDYGGNLIVHSNLVNKINIKKFKFYLYNPYASIIKKKFSFRYKFIIDKNYLYKKKFNLIYFGSSLQYIEDFSAICNLKFIESSDYILITHTPISFNKKNKLLFKQKNQSNLNQNIYSIDYIKKVLLRNKFQLIFKSLNEHKYSGLKKKTKDIYSVNMLFKKK